jgi:hypothetical protein
MVQEDTDHGGFRESDFVSTTCCTLSACCATADELSVIPAVGCQIYYSNKSLNSNDPTFTMWQAVVAMQIVQCLSIVTACVPYLKPFLDSLESGQLRADDLRRRGKTGVSGYGSHPSGGDSTGPKPIPADATASAGSQQSKLLELVEFPKAKQRSSVTVIANAKEPGTNWDGQSHSSQTVLIQQTRTWDVDVEVRGAVSRDGL